MCCRRAPKCSRPRVSSDHIVVTIEVGGAVQVLTFDPDTLMPLGRLRLEQKP